MTDHADILVVGQSHTIALSHFLRAQPDKRIAVINYNDIVHTIPGEDRLLNKGEFHPSLLDNYSPKVVISMISGNYHNVFGLIENPVKFDFMAPDMRIEEVDETRRYVPYQQMYDFFNSRMRSGFLKTLLDMREVCKVPLYHVCSPPPHPDNDFIVANPGGYFADKVSMGVAPAGLRKRMYDLHSRVFREFCKEHDIGFIEVPEEATDERGFLAKPYWRNDPTHANQAYGGLVLNQINELVPA